MNMAAIGARFVMRYDDFCHKHMSRGSETVDSTLTYRVIAVFVDQARPQFSQHPEHTGDSRATSEPQSQWVSMRALLRFEVPEEEMFAANIKPASVLRAASIAYVIVLAFDANAVGRCGTLVSCKFRCSTR